MRNIYLSILEYLVRREEKKARKKFGGIPVFHAIYKPDQEGKNVVFLFHPDLADIEGQAREHLQKVADLIRESEVA